MLLETAGDIGDSNTDCVAHTTYSCDIEQRNKKFLPEIGQENGQKLRVQKVNHGMAVQVSLVKGACLILDADF